MREGSRSEERPGASLPRKRLSTRVVKVFISSTFRDFQKERDELVRKTFPMLRDYCTRRRILFIDVDLRWGITEQQAQAGEILPICLEEIDNSRPFFIGLLGERYGWVPTHIPADLLRKHSWLSEHWGKSITELEIVHGALRDSALLGRRFFYFRSPSYHRGLPSAEQSDYVSSDETSVSRLTRLKDLIRREAREARVKLVESYDEPAELAELVYADLKAAIDVEFPEEEAYDELDQERLAQEMFVESRASILVERAGPLEELTERLCAQPFPVVVTGAPGSGKTSLLVSLALRLAATRPAAKVFTNFVGVGANSTDYVQIVRRLLAELSPAHESTAPPPEGRDEVLAYFRHVLAELPAEPEVFVVFDGLDQLADVEEALEFGWLPDGFPEHVRVVVSASSERAMDIFSRRGWPTFALPTLTLAEREELVSRYLARYGKELDPGQVDSILEPEQAASPLYLCAFLEEIRIFGDFTKLNDRIRYYLASRDAVALYEKILQRLEADHDEAHPDLVRRAFSLLAASRHGLTENELRDMLGVPRVAWSHLHLAIRESLTNTLGYITFFHGYLKKAVEDRYLRDAAAKRAVHLELADYFAGTGDIDRKAEELPWQLTQAQAWPRLRDSLSRFDVFMKLMLRGRQLELLRYWRMLQPQYDIAATYTEALARYEATNPSQSRLEARLRRVSEFFTRCGLVREATPILEKIKQLDDETFKDEYLGELEAGRIDNLLALAANLMDTQRFEEAEALLHQATEVWKRLPAPREADHARILNSLAYVQKSQGRHSEAETNYRTAMALDPRPAYTNNLATLLRESGRIDEAERLYRTIVEDPSANKDHRAAYLSNLATILLEKGDLTGAERYYQEALAINRARLGPKHFHLAVNLCRYADLLLRKMEAVEAEKLVTEAITIFETRLGADHPRTKSAYAQREEIGLMREVFKRVRALRPSGDEDSDEM